MRSTYLLLCILSTLTPLLAYPVDYNETAVNITTEALNQLRNLVFKVDFSDFLEQFNAEVYQLNNKTHEKIKAATVTYSLRLSQLQESASNVNATATDCLKDLDLIEEEFYQEYTQECASPALTAGLNLAVLGYNKQTVVYFNKYSELMDSFNGCLAGADPAPQICAGVVEGTLQEAKRIIPRVNANRPQVLRELQRQVLIMASCAYEHTSAWNKRLQVELNNAKTCVLDKINTA